jgi:hypothetical protein
MSNRTFCKLRVFILSLTIAPGLPCVATAFGQDYPVKPVRMVTAEPGGGNDFAARLIAQGLAGELGQRIIVDNRGIGAAEIAAKAPPDGYTLLLYGNPLWLLPLLRNNAPYDAVRDFSPVTLAARSPLVVVVHPSVPARSIRELIALARARPGELNYGSGGAGSTPHLAVELFKSMAAVNIVRVAYKGNAQSLNDLIAGQVQLMFTTSGPVWPHVKSGRLRALAVTSAEPSPLAPGLPAAATAGLPGYESSSVYGVFAPAGTPATIIARLNREIVRLLNRPEVKERFLGSGVDTVGGTADQLAATVKSEITKWGKVIRDAGIRDE